MRTLHLHNSISVKQILFLWFVLCLLPSVVHATNRCDYRCDNSITVPLLIDQKTQVGVVKVNYDDHRLNIKYVANEGWLIKNTHLAVSDSFSGLPKDSEGNPQLNNFPYQTSHQSPVSVVNHMLSAQQWPLGTELYIAAQADVVSTKSGIHDKYGQHHKKHYSAKSWHDDSDRHSSDNDGREGRRSYSNFNKFKGFFDRVNQATHRHSKHRYSKNRRHKKVSFFKRFGSAFDVFGGKANGDNDHDYTKHDGDHEYDRHEDDDRSDEEDQGYNDHGHQSQHDYKRCDSGHNNDDRAQPAWAKGDALTGTAEGYYFTFTLKPCKPVSESTIQFSDAVYSSSEDEQNATVTVTRTGDLDEEATVVIRTADGTAQSGIDYGAIDMQLQFAPGTTSIDVSIPVIDDSDVEDPETINVQLFDAQGATLGNQDTSVVEVADNDVAPLDEFFFDPADYVFREGSGLVTITVARQGSLVGEASVDYLVVGGTAQANVDYTFIPGTLVFADGQATADISLTIREDRAVDPNETILIGIDNAVNGQIKQPATAAVITIEDNEGNN
ncbi:MAG: Calx-beta domain-containing protein [Gammaproteobacteria bacterium]|jgi:hypothetical protein